MIPSQANRSQHGSSQSRPLFILQGDHFDIENIGLDLLPEGTLGSAANRDDCLKLVSFRLIQIQNISEGKDNSLQYGANKIVALMDSVNADKAAADVRIGVWRPLTNNVRGKEQPISADC